MLENFVQGQTECACCKYQCIISHRYARVSFMLILVLSQLKLWRVAPTQFQWQLDFSLTCEPPLNVRVGTTEGISEAECYIEPISGGNITDLVPVEVTSIVVFELDNNFDLIKSSRDSNLSLIDGNIYSYTR